jgi:four helix bundle protein
VVARTFDHEKPDVYQLELRFVAWADDLIDEVLAKSLPRTRLTCDHLDRAGLSMTLNTAEGNGKRQRHIRGRFFDDVRGSTGECGACLDLLVAKKACDRERIADGKDMLVRIFEMLTKLVSRYSTDERVGETEVGYPARSCVDEDEDSRLMSQVGSTTTTNDDNDDE